MASTVVQFRVDDDLKNRATEIFEDLGLDLPTAFRMFLKRSVKEEGIPFKVKASKKESKMLKMMRQISQKAEDDGIADMTLDEINAEISAYRSGQ